MNVEAYFFARNDWVPNNPDLPVLYYRYAAVQQTNSELGNIFEALFESNGWPAQWRDGIYGFHHYHSTAHEVIACISGTARLMLGGPGRTEFVVSPGEVIALPAGTGHRCINATDDFLVIGAYPAGQEWDICRQSPSAEMLERMGRLPFPSSDPIEGRHGALPTLWAKR